MTKILDKDNSPAMWADILDKDTLEIEHSNVVSKRIHIISHLLRNLDGTVLNIGAGQGYLERSIIWKDGLWISSDITDVGLSKISKYCSDNKNISKLSELLLNASSLPFKNYSVDIVLALEVIEHMNSVMSSKFYEECKRVLKDDGKAIFSVPVFEPSSLIDHPVGHIRKYTVDEFRDELIAHGFIIEQLFRVYAFNNNYAFKKFLSERFGIRRPSVIIVQVKC